MRVSAYVCAVVFGVILLGAAAQSLVHWPTDSASTVSAATNIAFLLFGVSSALGVIFRTPAARTSFVTFMALITILIGLAVAGFALQ
jgi:MFS-type transporter involved in bile tolerance (Atg22 family)